ncbi:MAG: creatininase family protein [Pirellulales bacterium]|nr:creatininase family protein [Pirellulales bacterium]
MHFDRLSWPQLARVAPGAVALLPLAAIEQHGPHLASGTDHAIVSHLAGELEAARPDFLVLCPGLPYGSSHHHLAFGATISLPAALYSEVVVALAESLLAAGFRRILLLNGHGGNMVPVRQALAALSHAHSGDTAPPLVALATYWEVAGKAFAGEPPMQTPALSHACEYETSMMLHIFPERVDLAQAGRARRPPASGWIPWEDEHPGRGIVMAWPTHRISSSGGSGDPRLATAEKGRHLLSAARSAFLTFLDDFRNWPFPEDLRP